MCDSDRVAIASKLETALETLGALNIPLQGPFITPKQNHIYLVDGCLLTEAELVAFNEAGRFTPERIRDFLRNLRATQARPQAYYLEPAAGPVFQDRRRSERVMLRLDLLVRLEISEGRLQTHAFTLAVNTNGGQLRSPFRMAAGQKITLINPQTGKDVECRVVGVDRTAEGDYLAAFAFGQPDPSFWPTANPAPTKTAFWP
jgi:hypothetical protein